MVDKSTDEFSSLHGEKLLGIVRVLVFVKREGVLGAFNPFIFRKINWCLILNFQNCYFFWPGVLPFQPVCRLWVMMIVNGDHLFRLTITSVGN